MATTVEFLDPKRVKVTTNEGDVFILGYSDTMNYQIEQQDGWYSKCVIALFDHYYKGDDSVIMGAILSGMLKSRLNSFLWYMRDRDKERERIGNRIRELRKAQGIDAKELSQRAGIDPANLSRIEQGRLSVGLDILNKIAGGLNMSIDFVPKSESNVTIINDI